MDRQGNPLSPPPVEAQDRHSEEELLPMIRIITRMMDEQEERLRSELRVYVRELLIQARIEELLRRRRS